MTENCPLCNEPMHEETREMDGVSFKVEVCPVCKEEWVDMNEHDKLYKAIMAKRKGDKK